MKVAEPDAALFRIEGDQVFPSDMTQGPWNPEHQHGGAVSGLLAHCVEACPSPVPMRTVRMSIDLMRAVPMRPLSVRSRIVRSGRRIQVVDVSLLEGEIEVARASALRMRVAKGMGPIQSGETVAFPYPPLASRPGGGEQFGRRKMGYVPGFIRAVEYERISDPQSGEVAVAWTRLRCRIVEGEDPSPQVRVATLADFTSGTGSTLDYTRWTCINADLTIHFEREPESDWIAIQAQTALGRDGAGQSIAVIYDLVGPVARSQTSLLLEARPDGTGPPTES